MPKTQGDLSSRVQAAAAQLTAPPPEARTNSVVGFLNDGNTAKQMTRLLGSEAQAERFMRIALTLCRATPRLLACSMESFAGALMTCAQLKLEPGPPLGLAWMVPYDVSKKVNGTWVKVPEVQFQLGYPGIIQLAMRSGQLANLSAQTVCEGDEFGFDYLTGEKHHKPPKRGLRGKAIGFYCHARFANGGEHFLYVSREEMLAHRDRYAAGRQFKKGPWYEDADKPETPLFDAMGRKTVVRMSRAYLPASAEFIMALNADEQVARLDRSGSVVLDDEELEGIRLDGVVDLGSADAETPEAQGVKEGASAPVAMEAAAPTPVAMAAPAAPKAILVRCPGCEAMLPTPELKGHMEQHHAGDLGPEPDEVPLPLGPDGQ